VRRRFFVEQFASDTAVMEGEAAHHLGRVLRAQIGQLYELSDGERVWLARIESVGRDRVQFALVEELPAVQPSLDITLLLAVVKFDAFEWAIEKATELGVSTIVPLAAERSERALLTAAVKRADRWKKSYWRPHSNRAASACPCWPTWQNQKPPSPAAEKGCE